MDDQGRTTEIHEIVRDRRRTLGLTQEEVAALAETTRNQVAAVERGQVTDYMIRLERILDVLGLDLTVRPRSGHTPIKEQ